jgi:hypothetical protein
MEQRPPKYPSTLNMIYYEIDFTFRIYFAEMKSSERANYSLVEDTLSALLLFTTISASCAVERYKEKKALSIPFFQLFPLRCGG